MKFASTRHHSPEVSFRDALLRSEAPDGGLYMPVSIPKLPKAVVDNMPDMTPAEIGYVVLSAFAGSDLSMPDIKDVVDRALNFRIPIREFGADGALRVMELFEGPTLAFKDFGARIMAGILSKIPTESSARTTNIIMATTGNTGSAMASALYRRQGINVFIVFPRGTAGRALECQFTTLGQNIYPVEVSGSIDDCHALVAEALHDKTFDGHITMASANSGNISRILGQVIYWFYGATRIMADTPRARRKIAAALPAGNLGNLTAGLIAKRMGAPISRIIACENANNYLYRALTTQDFSPRRSIPTLAYAADKSVPTNIERILDLYPDIDTLRNDINCVTASDHDIIEGILDFRNRYGYLLDTHSAMAWHGVQEQLRDDETAMILATAHPAKSLTAMSAITGKPIDLPIQLTRFMSDADHRERIHPSYGALRRIITEINEL